MVLLENFFNEIETTTTVKNAVDFNIKTHDRMIRSGQIPYKHSNKADAYSIYPALPSRRLIQSRSSHYPLLRKIYTDLPDRIMFYIPKIRVQFLSRTHSMDIVYQLAANCIFDFMRVNYKHLNNDIVPKERLGSDKHHSMLKKYMPDYYYIYKATQFIKNFKPYNTVNNYHFNNYTVFYILILTVFLLWPVYLDLYSLENGLVYVHSQYIKLIFLPNYIDFMSSFLKEHTRALYHFYSHSLQYYHLTRMFDGNVYVKLFNHKFMHAQQSVNEVSTYFDKPYLVHRFYWTNEASKLLVDIHSCFNLAYKYLGIALLYPFRFYFSFMSHHVGEIRNYYFFSTLVVFILIMKHAAGGFNQVIKDYVGTKGGFMTSYTISSIVTFIFFSLLYLNVYKEEPEMITNIFFHGEIIVNYIISCLDFGWEAGKGMLLFIAFTYII